MGKSHALSGAVGWLAGAAVLAAVGVHLEPATVYAGAAVSAGLALLPDFDHPGSTATRTLGPISRLVHEITDMIAVAARWASCGHCRRTDRDGGHRGLTHTALGAALAGLAVFAAVLAWGRQASLVTVGMAVWLLAHAAMNAKRRAQLGDVVLPGRFRFLGRLAFRGSAAVGAALAGLLVTGLVQAEVPADGWRWLGVAVGWGCLAHSLGDALTFSRVPLLWPIRIGGCRWARVGAPDWMRFRTGSRTETAVVALMAVAGVAALGLIGATT